MKDGMPIRTVTAVIVTYNSAGTIEACLRSVLDRAASEPADLVVDVVVVDNASLDGTPQRAAIDPRVRVVPGTGNIGLAAGNNLGMQMASTADAYLICNPDTVLGPGALGAMVDCLDRYPLAAFVVPKVVNPDGSLQPSVGALPRLRTALRGHEAALDAGAPPDSEAMWWSGWPHDTEREVPRGLEACYLVRATAVAEVGMQDVRFFLDWEGVEWTRRMRSSGWIVWFTPKAVVMHIGSVSIRQARWRALKHSHLGVYRYYSDELQAWQRPLLAVGLAFRAVIKASASAARRRSG